MPETIKEMFFFADRQAPGAIPNGYNVVKVKTEPGDAHEVGTRGKVLGSLSHPELPDIGYFIEWDDMPGVPVFTMGCKIALPPTGN